MTKIISLSLILVILYSVLSMFLYFRENEYLTEAMLNAAMERVIRGDIYGFDQASN